MTLKIPTVIRPVFAWIQKCGRNRHSQSGEDGMIASILDVIGTKNQWAFECGAGDGVALSNTLALLEKGWQGIMVEQNARHFRMMERRHSSPGGIRLGLDKRVVRINMAMEHEGEKSPEAVIRRAGAPMDIDLFSLDTDGDEEDFLIHFDELRPRVMVVEFVAILYMHLDRMLGVLDDMGYVVVGQTLTNLIAVPAPLSHQLERNHV